MNTKVTVLTGTGDYKYRHIDYFHNKRYFRLQSLSTVTENEKASSKEAFSFLTQFPVSKFPECMQNTLVINSVFLLLF